MLFTFETAFISQIWTNWPFPKQTLLVIVFDIDSQRLLFKRICCISTNV